MTWAIPPIRTVGIASGLALAALLVLAFWVPASSQLLGAGVRITAMAPGEVHVPDFGRLPQGRKAHSRWQGRTVATLFPLTNVTRGPLDVRLRARMASHELDRALHLELGARAARCSNPGRSRICAAGRSRCAWSGLARARSACARGSRRGAEGHRRPPGGGQLRARRTSWRRRRGDDRADHPAQPPPGGGQSSRRCRHCEWRGALLRFLGMTVTGFAIGIALALALPLAFHARPLVVLSGSMTPALRTGDVSVVRSIAPLDARPGRHRDLPRPRQRRSASSRTACTRCTSGRRRGGSARAATPTTWSEHWRVPASGEIGRVIYSVPKLGWGAGRYARTKGLFVLDAGRRARIAAGARADLRSGAGRKDDGDQGA